MQKHLTLSLGGGVQSEGVIQRGHLKDHLEGSLDVSFVVEVKCLSASPIKTIQSEVRL